MWNKELAAVAGLLCSVNVVQTCIDLGTPPYRINNAVKIFISSYIKMNDFLGVVLSVEFKRRMTVYMQSENQHLV